MSTFTVGYMSGRRSKKDRYTIHNSVNLLLSGEEFFGTLEKLIRSAEQEIYFETYIFESDETGKRIASALIEASRLRKVRIYLLVDAYGSQKLSASLIREMKDAGIEFRQYGRLYYKGRLHIGRRLHRKVVVIDGRTAVVGGINISNNYNDIGGSIAWLDFAVIAEGDVCKRIHYICHQRWNNFAFPRFSGKRGWTSPEPREERKMHTLVRVGQNDFLRQKNQVAMSYRQAIRQSMSSILIVGGYFLPGGQMRRLLRNASRRGVDITLLVSAKSDVKVSIYARQYLYSWLFRNKIRIYEYLPSNVHGKVLVTDRKFVSIGSYDLNNLSTYINIELNLDIYDEEFAKRVLSVTDEILKKDCKLVTEEDYRLRAGLWHKVVIWAAYRFIKTLFVLLLWVSKRKEKDF